MSARTTSISKKEARKIIFEKLSAALAEYKNNFKEKRFNSNLKKASKLFAGDILNTINKKKVKLEKPTKKKNIQVPVKEAS